MTDVLNVNVNVTCSHGRVESRIAYGAAAGLVPCWCCGNEAKVEGGCAECGPEPDRAIEPSKWLYFRELEVAPARKTKVWNVESRGPLTRPLGVIRWHNPWRRYAFFPEHDTLYDVECLMDIAIFTSREMAKRRGE